MLCILCHQLPPVALAWNCEITLGSEIFCHFLCFLVPPLMFVYWQYLTFMWYGTRFYQTEPEPQTRGLDISSALCAKCLWSCCLMWWGFIFQFKFQLFNLADINQHCSFCALRSVANSLPSSKQSKASTQATRWWIHSLTRRFSTRCHYSIGR